MTRPQQSKRDRDLARRKAETQRRNNPVKCRLCNTDLRSWERPEGLCDSCLKGHTYYGPVSR